MTSQKDDGNGDKVAFTVRLYPPEMLLMRAHKSKLTRANGGRTVSYSRAVASMLKNLPKSQFDKDVLSGEK